jgi:predicted secreted protein
MNEKDKMEEVKQSLKRQTGNGNPPTAAPTTAISGKDGVVTGANSASEVTEWSVSLTAEALEATSMDSNGWREFIVGLQGASGSLTCIGARPTTGSAASLVLKTKSSGGVEISGAAIFSSVEVATPVDGVVTYSADFTFTGEVTVA